MFGKSEHWKRMYTIANGEAIEYHSRLRKMIPEHTHYRFALSIIAGKSDMTDAEMRALAAKVLSE